MTDPAAPRPRPIRFLRVGAAPVLFAAVASFPPLIHADEAQDLKAAIVMRCYYAVGEFGSELVDRCVKDDLAASQALQQYPKEVAPVIRSCTDRLLGDGFGRIKACVDEAVKAGPDK
jgi:hypothetical protein